MTVELPYVVDTARHNDGEAGLVGAFPTRDAAQAFIDAMPDEYERRWATIRPVLPPVATLVLYLEARMQEGRLRHVRDMCASSIEHDKGKLPRGCLTDRQWLAQNVLNVLDGSIDDQIREELDG